MQNLKELKIFLHKNKRKLLKKIYFLSLNKKMSYQFIDGIISQEDGLYHRCPVKQHKVCVPDRRSYRKKSKSPSKINYYVRVMNGSLNKTPGGLTKKDLMYNKKGLIVSKKKSRAGKLNFKYLKSNGYAPKKGVSVEENIKMFEVFLET